MQRFPTAAMRCWCLTAPDGIADRPENVSVLQLPPYSPEINPVETVFQFLKARHFANQVFEITEAVSEMVVEF